MKRQHIFLLLLMLFASLASSCTSGHLGGNEIAFIRDGHLWTIDPDGANAFAIVTNTTSVVGYSWSPTHQILAFRSIDDTFAHAPAAAHIPHNPITDAAGDFPSTLNTIGIDGGFPIPIMFSDSTIQYSNAWWNTTGNRLLYREELLNIHNPTIVQWWMSQNDQPGGIARKSLPFSFSIPSISPDNSMATGNFNGGIFTTDLTGANQHFIVKPVIPGHPLPATLERVLWQPAHNQPRFLYAIGTGSNTPQPLNASATNRSTQLVLGTLQGQITPLITCTCTQFAWSPDGNSILYSTGTSYTVLNVNNGSSFSIEGEASSVPYWSPDSQFLLLDGFHSLSLVEIASHHQQILLSDGNGSSGSPSSSESEVNALLQPALNSPWSADSRHFLFLTHSRLFWQNQHISAGRGLYTVVIDNHGQAQSSPTVVDTGNDSQAGWTYEDPNTSFLF